MGLPNPSSCETKFSAANGDSEEYIFPVQLADHDEDCGNLTRLIRIALAI